MGSRCLHRGRAHALTMLDKDHPTLSREGQTIPELAALRLLAQPAETMRHHFSYKQILLWLIKGSLFLIPFLVFQVSSNLPYTFTIGRNFLFRVLVELSFACWLGVAALQRSYVPSQRNPLLWAVWGFLLITGLADIMGSLDPYRSFWGNYERMEGYLSLVHFGGLFLVLTSVLEDKDWKIFWNLFLVAGVMTALYTILVNVGIFPAFLPAEPSRPGSFLGNADLLSTYLLLTGWIGLLLWCMASSRSKQLLYGAATLLQFTSLYLPAARAVILSLLGGVFLFCLLYGFFGEHRSYRRLATVFTIGLMALPLLYFAVRESRFVQADHLLSRFSTLTDPSNRSLTSRLGLWAMLWKGFQERPLLGWGQEQAGQVMMRYVYSDPGFSSRFTDQEGSLLWFDRAHNIVFEWLINAGILGLLSYLSLFGCAFYLLWRLRKRKILRVPESITLCALLISYFVQNLFYFDSLTSYVMFFAILAYIGSMESRAKSSPNWIGYDPASGPIGGRESLAAEAGSSVTENYTASRDKPATGRRYEIFILGASLFLNFVIVTTIVNVQPYLQARTLGATFDLFKTHNLDLVMEHFDHTLSYQTFGDTETRIWIFYLADQLYRDPRQPYAVKVRVVQYALREYEKEVKAHSSDLRAQQYLTILKKYQQELQLQQPAPDAVLRQ